MILTDRAQWLQMRCQRPPVPLLLTVLVETAAAAAYIIGQSSIGSAAAVLRAIPIWLAVLSPSDV